MAGTVTQAEWSGQPGRQLSPRVAPWEQLALFLRQLDTPLAGPGTIIRNQVSIEKLDCREGL